MKLTYIVLLLCTLMILGCTGSSKPEQNVNNIPGNSNMPNTPTNPTTPTTPSVQPQTIDVSGKSLGEVFDLKMPLDCDITFQNDNVTLNEKWYFDGNEKMRVELTQKTASDSSYSLCKTPGFVVIMSKTQLLIGCKDGNIMSYSGTMSSCAWIAQNITSDGNNDFSVQLRTKDPNIQIQKCVPWVVDSSKLEGSGKTCSLFDSEIIGTYQ